MGITKHAILLLVPRDQKFHLQVLAVSVFAPPKARTPFAHRVFGRDGQLLDMALSYLGYGMSGFRKDIFVQILKSITCERTYIPSIIEENDGAK